MRVLYIYRIPPRFILVSQDTHFSFALFDNAAGGQLSPSWPLLLSVDFDEKDMRDYFRKRLYKSYKINYIRSFAVFRDFVCDFTDNGDNTILIDR